MRIPCSLLMLFIALLEAGAFAAGSANMSLLDAARKGDGKIVREALKSHPDVNVSGPGGATALMWAAHQDDLETAGMLLHAGADVNASNEFGAGALSLACDNGSAAMVALLLKAGANPNAALLSGETALMTCASRGSVEAVQSLLERGAKVNVQEPRNGQSALMWAIADQHPSVARLLIEHGADVRAHTKTGFTPLMFAAQQGDLESAQVLLASNADLNGVSPESGSALGVAVSSRHEKFALALLEKGADPNLADADGYTPLHHAASSPGMVETVKALLARGAKPNARLVNNPARGNSNPNYIGATPFFLAASARNVAALRLLAAAGADSKLGITETTFLNASNGHRLQMVAGSTPLMAAAGSGRYKANYPQFTEAEEANALEAMRLILELGADVNGANEWGQNALHTAAYLGADKLIRFLVEKGARVDSMDKFGQTPLSIANRVHTVGLGENFDMQPRRVYESTIALLLKMGAAPLEASGVRIVKEISQ